MFRPGDNDAAETHTSASFVTLQSRPLRQVVAELAKSSRISVPAETWCGYHPKPHEREAGRVGMAVLKTKIHDAVNNDCAQVVVGEHCRRNKFRQDLDNGESIGVGDQGPVDEIFYLTVPKQ